MNNNIKDTLTKFKDKICDYYFEKAEVIEADPMHEDIETEMKISDTKWTEPNDNCIPEQCIEPAIPIVKEDSIISFKTEIQGHIVSDSSLIIHGSVIGDVSSYSNITIENAKIVGNINAVNVTIINSNIQGCISASSFVCIQSQSDINGQVKAESLTLDCFCNGNVYVDNYLILKSNANITGDIQTSKLKIEEGAIVLGQIKME